MNAKTLVLSIAILAGCGPQKPPLVQLEVAKIAVTQPGRMVGRGAQTSVPAGGGKVASADGRLSINVPAGVLPAAQMITIQSITNEAPGGAGLAYRLGPEALKFSAPVKVTFSYGKSDIAGSSASALRIAYQDKDGRWNAPKTVVVDETAKTVTVETTHFSDWSLLQGWQLRPPTSSVGAAKSVDLQVVACAMKGTGSDELAELVYTCVPDAEFFTIENWSVNGVTGGTGAVGTIISGQEGLARYSAPNGAPANNPVSVSGWAREKSGKKTLLTGSVWVEARPPLTGIITSSQVAMDNPGNVVTTSANVTFKYDVADGAYHVSTGTLNAQHDVVAPNCEQHRSYSGQIGAQDGTIMLDEAVANYFAQGVSLLTLKGTTTCNSPGKVDPLSVLEAVYWWPAPTPTATTATPLALKKDGRLEEVLVDFKTSGMNMTVQWSLLPEL